MANPRQIAFQALLKTEKDGAFSNLALDAVLSKSDLDTRDKSFVSNLFYGVIERKLTLDYNLATHLTKPLKRLKPEVLTIMRLGAYQILYMDRVPDSAAVNESVNLTRKNNASYAAGLVNLVLRRVSAKGLQLPEDDNSIEYYSVLYSCPEWLIRKWVSEYGYANTLCTLISSVSNPETYIRVNTTKTTDDELINILSDEGAEAEKTYNPSTLKIRLYGNDIENLPSFKQGLFHVQDIASQLCAKALQAQEGDTVFDLCSAPGGKAYTVCEMMNDNGRVLCFDIYDNRVSLILKGAERLSLKSIEGKVGDASVYNESLGLADKVLCDVPCSGLGIIRRKPEIKYKKEEDLASLSEIQLAIINNAARYVKVGGRLVYSTCTLSKAENEDVCESFLSENKNFKATGVFSEDDECMKTLIPYINESDGFFIACFKREE